MSRKIIKNTFNLISTLTFLQSCVGITEVDKSSSARNTSKSTAGTNQAFVYLDNPIILSGKELTTAQYTGYLTSQFITSKPTLEGDCTFEQSIADFGGGILAYDSTLTNCFTVYNENVSSATPLLPTDDSWDYEIDTDEFYQINTFYHTQKIIQKFFDAYKFAHDQVHFYGPMTIPPATKHNLGSTKSFWLYEQGSMSQLKAYAKCMVDLNAFFSPALDTLCYGVEGGTSNFRMVQDPAVIYHETGHVFVHIMMNQRNITSELGSYYAHPFESNLGELTYDEAGAINEGIADYFVYAMTNRTTVAEFAFKKIAGNPRPLEESEEAHSAEVSTTSGERLSYPNFLHYDPLAPGENVEDVHNAGGIVGHYLVALTKQLKNSCTFKSVSDEGIHDEATNYVIMLINESLAEIGDLTGTGSDFLSYAATNSNALQNVFFTNLNSDASFLWTQVVNPPNYRRFFQIFGKNIFHYISSDLCPQFSVDMSERLLDDFGLLLFKSYEDSGNGINSQTFASQNYELYKGTTISTTSLNNRQVFPAIFSTQVNESNRRYTTLISKDFIEIDSTTSAFVIDGQAKIREILSNLTFEGSNVLTTEGLAGPEYNNNNIKFSPGEVLALALNIKNTSNSIMGGVQILANDWDHMKLNSTTDIFVNNTTNITGLFNGDISGGIATHSPCIYDNFPQASEGGVTDSSSTTQGNCSFTSKSNKEISTSTMVGSTVYPTYDLDSPQPICLVQYNDSTDTKWVSQDYFRKNSIGLEDSECLNNPSMSGNKFNPNECLIRFLPGASQSIYGKIDPQKTWPETMRGDSDNDINFTQAQIQLLEINKLIPPGTKFNCRFRARFTNCSDCFDANTNTLGSLVSDFQDSEYTGKIPYKIIDFQFTVLD